MLFSRLRWIKIKIKMVHKIKENFRSQKIAKPVSCGQKMNRFLDEVDITFQVTF